jgi:hypothetical protein
VIIYRYGPTLRVFGKAGLKALLCLNISHHTPIAWTRRNNRVSTWHFGLGRVLDFSGPAVVRGGPTTSSGPPRIIGSRVQGSLASTSVALSK